MSSLDPFSSVPGNGPMGGRDGMGPHHDKRKRSKWEPDDDAADWRLIILAVLALFAVCAIVAVLGVAVVTLTR